MKIEVQKIKFVSLKINLMTHWLFMNQCVPLYEILLSYFLNYVMGIIIPLGPIGVRTGANHGIKIEFYFFHLYISVICSVLLIVILFYYKLFLTY